MVFLEQLGVVSEPGARTRDEGCRLRERERQAAEPLRQRGGRGRVDLLGRAEQELPGCLRAERSERNGRREQPIRIARGDKDGALATGRQKRPDRLRLLRVAQDQQPATALL